MSNFRMNRNRYRENDRIHNMEQFVYNDICPDLAAKKLEFLGAIEEIFEPIKFGKKQNNFEWVHVKNFYNEYKSELTALWSLRIFCEFVFKLLLKFDCEDDELIKKIIYMHHQVLNEYKSLGLCENCMQFDYPMHYHYENLVTVRSVLRKVNKGATIIYSYTNRYIYLKLTMEAIEQGDGVFLQFLVKYGLCCFPNDEMNQLLFELRELCDSYGLLKKRAGNAIDIKEDDFADFVSKQMCIEVENPNLRRFFLIVRAVHICMFKCLDYKFHLEYVEGFNLCALSLPEVAVSMKDVEDFAHLAFADDEDFITEICFSFKEVFPDTPSLSSPRSLKYLCRCKVRDGIKKTRSLPIIVSEMQIPCSVKDYLLFLSN